MSLSSSPKNFRTNLTSRRNRTVKKNIKSLAIDYCKKLYHKLYSEPSQGLLEQIRKNSIELNLDKLCVNDISIISELINKYSFFNNISVSINEKVKSKKTVSLKYTKNIMSEFDKFLLEKEKKMKIKHFKTMIKKLIWSLSKHLSNSKSIKKLIIHHLSLEPNYYREIANGLKLNESLEKLSLTNIKIPLDSYEVIIESLLSHNLISILDLSNDNLSDKCGKILSRLIIRSAQRRDQVIWYYSLRNELPINNDYKKGLISINLSNNNLGHDSAEYICSALILDQYIRLINLRKNKFNALSCKKFIYMMRKNLSILTIDLRDNPGYDNIIHSRLVMKMSKNIRFLYHQYKKGLYSKKEFENYKQYIETSFFDVNIPKQIVDFYNENIYENIEEKKDNKNYKNMNNCNKSPKKNEQTNFSNLNNLKEENNKLYSENLKLKKELVELKAKKLKDELCTKKKNDEDTNENSSSTERDYKKVEDLISKLNKLMDKIEKKKIKKKSNSTYKQTKNDNLSTNISSKQKNFIKKKDIKVLNKDNINKIIDKNNKKEEVKNNNIIISKKFNEKNEYDEEDDSHLEDENGNIYNLDDLTEQEKMAIIQQQLFLQKLQEEAEERGEKFNIEEYIEALEKQEQEELDEIPGKKHPKKLNKSF